MTDSNGKGPLYFVFLNENKKLIYAGTTAGINNDDDFNLKMVTPDGGGDQDQQINDVVTKIMNNGTMKKYFSKNSSSVVKSKGDDFIRKEEYDNLLKTSQSLLNSIMGDKSILAKYNEKKGQDQDQDQDQYTTSIEHFLNEGKGFETIVNSLDDFENPDNSGLKKYKVVNVGGDGNCFFYALFYGILAKCDTGKGATELIKEMFKFEIDVNDNHVQIAKDSNQTKEDTSDGYKKIEVEFTKQLREVLKKDENYKEKLKEHIQIYGGSDPNDKNILDAFDEFYHPSIKTYMTNGNIDEAIERYLAIFTNNDYKNESTGNPIYPEVSSEQVEFIKEYIEEKGYHIHIEFKNGEPKDNYYFFDYPNVIRLYKAPGHYQYIIPESPSPSSGGGKRKTQRKRPKSSHKNKSIKTK